MLISEAYAQTAGGTTDMLTSLLPLVLIFVVFYFLLIRPQQKKMKQHREMLAAIRRGDRVVTGGGIIGVVTKVANENELIVEIADGVKVKVMRGTVAEVLAKTEPAGGGKGGKEEPDAEAEEAATAEPASPVKKAGNPLSGLFGR